MVEKRAIGSVVRMWSENLSPQFSDSLAEMLLYSQATLCGPDEFIYYDHATVSYHETARCELVDKSIGEWMLMLDTDHTFSPDLLQRLLYLRAKHNTQVLSGIYQFKNPPHGPVANTWSPDGNVEPLTTWDRNAEILEVGPVGGGCLLVNRDVFKQIEDKYRCGPFNIIQGLSEDYSFCKRCRELGIPVHLAPKVECHHLMPARQALTIDDYLASLPKAA